MTGNNRTELLANLWIELGYCPSTAIPRPQGVERKQWVGVLQEVRAEAALQRDELREREALLQLVRCNGAQLDERLRLAALLSRQEGQPAHSAGTLFAEYLYHASRNQKAYGAVEQVQNSLQKVLMAQSTHSEAIGLAIELRETLLEFQENRSC